VSDLSAEITKNAIHFLRWRGITYEANITRRVNPVELYNSQLVKPFPTFLCRLPSLSLKQPHHIAARGLHQKGSGRAPYPIYTAGNPSRVANPLSDPTTQHIHPLRTTAAFQGWNPLYIRYQKITTVPSRLPLVFNMK